MAFRPLHDRVVIKRLEGEEKSKGGIIIPDSAKEKPRKARWSRLAPADATRAASSPLSTLRPETAYCLEKFVAEVKVDGDDLLIMKESDIMGVVG